MGRRAGGVAPEVPGRGDEGSVGRIEPEPVSAARPGRSVARFLEPGRDDPLEIHVGDRPAREPQLHREDG